MNHWILQSNPNSFHKSQGIPYRRGSKDWWGISRYFNLIEPGDTVYAWQSLDYRDSSGTKPRGIYAKAIINSVSPHRGKYVRMIKELMDNDHWMWIDSSNERHQKEKKTVIISFLASYASNPLTAGELISAKIKKLGPLRFAHADIYRLSDADVRGIERLLRGR